MNAPEALALLAKAALFDPSMMPATDRDRQLKAAAWAEYLADVPLADALARMARHYQRTDRRLMPAHLRPDGVPVRVMPLQLEKQIEAAEAAGIEPCPHGEPRGDWACPMCRRDRPAIPAQTDSRMAAITAGVKRP